MSVVTCKSCGRQNEVPADAKGGQYVCANCHRFLPAPSGDPSTAVGFIGGAALGAAIGGPPGAIIGAVLGALLGHNAKGLG
jgi:outer membrane lipoprotein SlyB